MDNSTAALNVMRTEVESCRLRLDIEVPPSRTTDVYERVVNDFNRIAKVPGFRPGKVPRKLLVNRYREEIADEVKNRLIRENIQAALDQEEITPETSPKVENEDAVTFTPGEPFVFAVTFDVAPEFEVPEYKGITISKDTSPVEDNEIQEIIDNWLQSRITYEKVERPAQPGDMLKVNYTATLPDGVEPPAEVYRHLIEAEETWLPLRQPTFPPIAIEDLTGLEAGDEKDVTAEYPEDFPAESLAGKSLSYHLEVIEVQGEQIPELTDDLAREVGAETADEVRERVRENLAVEKERAQDQGLREQILQTLLANLDFPLPQTRFRIAVYEALNSIYSQELRQGASEEDVRSRQKELMEQAEEAARRQLRRFYVLSRIADLEKIEVAPEEISAAVASLSQNQGVTPKVMIRRLRDNGRLGDIVEHIREAKTLDHLVELADIHETTPEKE